MLYIVLSVFRKAKELVMDVVNKAGNRPPPSHGGGGGGLPGGECRSE